MNDSLRPGGRRGRVLITILALATLGVLGLLVVASLYAGKTIFDLLGENRSLRQAISNLTHEDQIGYAKVLSQKEVDGRLMTRLLFVETDRQDKTRRLLEKEFDIEGDVVHFDALIVKFGSQVVQDGRERALYLWRRVYGETVAPAQGHLLHAPGSEPGRYKDICAKLSIRDRELFWSEIWRLSDDPEHLAAAGVQAIYGSVIYKQVRPGFIYVFRINSQGNLYPEAIPDL